MAERTATRWAADIRWILRQVLGQEALPVDVAAVAIELAPVVPGRSGIGRDGRKPSRISTAP